MPCDDAGEQPHRRPGIARVERAGRRTEASQPSSQYSNRTAVAALDLDPEAAETGHRGLAVGAGCKIGDRRWTLGKCSENRVSMRDRLIAGHAQAPAHAPGGGNLCQRQQGHLRAILWYRSEERRVGKEW